VKKYTLLSLFFLSLIVSLGRVESVSAEITRPYTVDGKPQVVFGDSVPVLTYFGLENYAQDYVGGYTHFTFTYTHDACCYTSDPPLVYITDTDPRSTSTPTERTFDPAYALTPFFGGFGEPTDWYSYDIQFDVAGYTVVVTQATTTEIANFHRDIVGLTDSDWVAIANRHPITDPINNNSMSFTPVPIRDEPTSERLDPVIIVPGIMGSAYKNGLLVIDPILHTYDDLIATLLANGYQENVDLFTFPYEWRDSNVFTANFLDDKIDEVKSICDCDKVDIVAHSMGGLVARAYIQSVDYDDDVDQIIFLGTPHKGAPKDYLTWEAGEFPITFFDTFVGLFFEAEALRNGYLTIFNYVHNRPILSVQELLPVFDYIKDNSTGIMRQYPNNYPRNFFLESLNNNTSSLLNSGVEVVNIIGNSGENKTINIIRVIPTDHAVFWEHGEPEGFGAIIGDSGLERGVGDNTVTSIGSSLDGVVSEELLVSHNRIPTVAANRIVKVVTGEDSTTNIDNGTNLDTKILLLQLLSPIDVVVTAPDGKKIGKNFETEEEYNEIPFAFYSGYQTDDEYITVLSPLDGEYKIEIQGTNNGGKYGILTSYVSDDTSVTKEISGLTESDQVTTLSVKVNNAGPESIEPEKIVTLEVLLNDIIKAYELGWITDKKLKGRLVKQIEAIIKVEAKIEKVEEKDKQNKDKKIEKLELKIDKKLARALLIELKAYEKDKINKEAYNIIKEDLEWLINN